MVARQRSKWAVMPSCKANSMRKLHAAAFHWAAARGKVFMYLVTFHALPPVL